MIPKGLFTQIGLLLLAVGIVVTYIRPSFAEITEAQNQIAIYMQERENIESFNDVLSERLNTIDSVPEGSRDRLLTYMPNSVDAVAVMRDLEDLAQNAGVVVNDITDGGPVERERRRGVIYEDAQAMVLDGPFAYSFSLTVRGSYNQVKDMLARFGRNNYPLEVRNLNMRADEGGFIEANVDLFTYSNMMMSEPVDAFSDVNVVNPSL
jgi:hypothetical protein